jgi:hypothetical protein
VTRRRRTFRDPTGRRALPVEVLACLSAVLGTLSEREAGIIRLRFGLQDGQPRTLNEIGLMYGVTIERVRQIESKTMSKLRDSKRSPLLRDFLGEDLLPVPEQVRARILGQPVESLPLVFCDRHGWFDPGPGPRRSSRTCEHCPCLMLEGGTGRVRRYCSDACRQAAYRHRKNSDEKNRQRRRHKKQ